MAEKKALVAVRKNEYKLTNSTYGRTKERIFVITAEDVIKHFPRLYSKNHW
jgi:hypothetical protein